MPDLLAALATNDAERQRKLIAWLRQGNNRPTHHLANGLAECCPIEPCCSAACPVCSREFQRHAVKLSYEAIRKPARKRLRNRTSLATMIPECGIVAPGELSVAVCLKTIDAIEAGLRAVGLPAIGTLDTSFNEDAEGEIDPHWCVHGAAIILDWLSDEQKLKLKAAFPRSAMVPKPVDVEELDQRENGRAYALKPDRFRRVSYIEKGDPNRKPYRNTHRRGLRPEQAVELAMVEHRLGFKNRLITYQIVRDPIGAVFDGFYNPRDGP